MARLTAVTKKDGGVRGIASGCSLRRLTARTLAKQFAKDFESECAPFQFALSTRAGTDCVGHLLNAATDVNPNVTVLSVDGVGAYDHILRAAMMSRLARMLNAKAPSPIRVVVVLSTFRVRLVRRRRATEDSDAGRRRGTR